MDGQTHHNGEREEKGGFYEGTEKDGVGSDKEEGDVNPSFQDVIESYSQRL